MSASAGERTFEQEGQRCINVFRSNRKKSFSSRY